MIPVAIFAYNRPDHLEEVINSLLKNKESCQTDVFLYCDGAKNSNDQASVTKVGDYARIISGFKTITIIQQEHNCGLAQSIIKGVSELLKEHEKIIVLEDDLVVSPFFLNYMNQALNLYEKDESVASIHAYSYPVNNTLPETFFMKGTDCWGWGTWQRAWNIFEENGEKLLCSLKEKKQLHTFDLDGCYPYTQMLYRQISGKNNSWAIRWHASAFLENMFTLNPGRSLVHNIGNDQSGTHSHNTKKYDVSFTLSDLANLKKIEITENALARETIKDYHLTDQWVRTILVKLRLNTVINRLMALRICFT